MKNNKLFTKSDMGECKYDNGGYFIVKGSEKVIVSQERKRENKIYCFKQKLVQSKYSHETEISSINSKSPAFVISTKVRLTSKPGPNGKLIRVNIRVIRSDIPLFIVFKALGIFKDKQIIEMIVYDLKDKNNMLLKLLKHQFMKPQR